MIMIKYGKEEHLKQIVNGKLRFTPSETYINIEKNQHNKGQGDLLEGKMVIHIEHANLHDLENPNNTYKLTKNKIILSIQDVTKMPVFCLSYYEDNYISQIQNESYIKLNEQHIDSLEKDFPEATHALIILEPKRFIHDVTGVSNHRIIGDYIHYYDYSINTLQMLMFLTTGSEEYNKKVSHFTMLDKNGYRHLLCKDISFQNQREYRFICLDELVDHPIFYPFNFTSKYLIVTLSDLKIGVKIESDLISND